MKEYPNIYPLLEKYGNDFLRDNDQDKSVLYDINDIDDLLEDTKPSEILRMCQKGSINNGEYFYIDANEGICIVEDVITYYLNRIDLQKFVAFLNENNIEE